MNGEAGLARLTDEVLPLDAMAYLLMQAGLARVRS
jgi:hypothetical protein